MLAQNFMTAADLGIADAERDALIKVLGMLERGEIAFAATPAKLEKFTPSTPNGFNMGPYIQEKECGTVACIAGWAHLVSGRTVFPWVGTSALRSNVPDQMLELFGMPRHSYAERRDVTVARAAISLRSYLTTGEASWAEPRTA